MYLSARTGPSRLSDRVPFYLRPFRLGGLNPNVVLFERTHRPTWPAGQGLLLFIYVFIHCMVDPVLFLVSSCPHRPLPPFCHAAPFRAAPRGTSSSRDVSTAAADDAFSEAALQSGVVELSIAMCPESPLGTVGVPGSTLLRLALPDIRAVAASKMGRPLAEVRIDGVRTKEPEGLVTIDAAASTPASVLAALSARCPSRTRLLCSRNSK